jgi:hypothetical protein
VRPTNAGMDAIDRQHLDEVYHHNCACVRAAVPVDDYRYCGLRVFHSIRHVHSITTDPCCALHLTRHYVCIIVIFPRNTLPHLTLTCVSTGSRNIRSVTFRQFVLARNHTVRSLLASFVSPLYNFIYILLALNRHTQLEQLHKLVTMYFNTPNTHADPEIPGSILGATRSSEK